MVVICTQELYSIYIIYHVFDDVLPLLKMQCLAQSFVPDNVKFQPCKELTESVNGFLVKLVELVNPDEDSSEFEHLG